MLYLYSKSKLPYILYYFFSKRREDRGLVFNILESQTFHFELGWANIEIIRAGKFLYRYQECPDPGPESNNLIDRFLHFLHFDPVLLNFLLSFYLHLHSME